MTVTFIRMVLIAFFTSSVSLPQLFSCPHPYPMQLSSSCNILVILDFCVFTPTVIFNCHNTPSILIFLLEGCLIAILLHCSHQTENWLTPGSFFYLTTSFSAPAHSSHQWYHHHQVLHSSTNSITYLIISISN